MHTLANFADAGALELVAFDSQPQYSFFFSSRRRHTRCSRDWSSDVCSSDLLAGHAWWAPLLLAGAWLATHWLLRESAVWRDRESRSEERRVGKECRSRWS